MSRERGADRGRGVTRGAVAAEKWRKRHKLSVTAFARLCGLDRRHVGRILAGETGARLTASTAMSISRATGGEVDADLFTIPVKAAGDEKAA